MRARVVEEFFDMRGRQLRTDVEDRAYAVRRALAPVADGARYPLDSADFVTVAVRLSWAYSLPLLRADVDESFARAAYRDFLNPLSDVLGCLDEVLRERRNINQRIMEAIGQLLRMAWRARNLERKRKK